MKKTFSPQNIFYEHHPAAQINNLFQLCMMHSYPSDILDYKSKIIIVNSSLYLYEIGLLWQNMTIYL